MKKDIIINATPDEIRIAITEDGRLAELFIENPDYERVVGDIYLGRVAKVIPGIKAAFIDLGFKQDAFLHFSDIGDQAEDFKEIFGEELDEDEEDEENTPPPKNQPHGKRRNPLPKLERGQKIIVQITKEPVGNKGVRVTSKISLPGRYLVFLPFENKINASKQIQDIREKRRLKHIVRNYRNSRRLEFGAIIRTVAEEQEEKSILEDLENLHKTWKEIEKKVKSAQPPVLLYKELSVTTSVIRDSLRDDVEKVVTDSKKLHKEMISYLKVNSPEFVDKVQYYKNDAPLFDKYNIESEIHQTLSKKVPLRIGGHLIIEKTEAMYVIDVNSGKYARSKDQETNSLKTNLEAAREVVRQIRLRDLGGIIVIDFIDVYDDKNKKKVYDELKKEFKKDRAKVTILPMSEFGLVQITRQRVRENVVRSITEQCPLCGGTGIVESSTNIVTRIERWIERFKAENSRISAGKLVLKVHPFVYKHLKEGTISNITKLLFKHLMRINLVEDLSLALQEFRFIKAKTGEDITEKFS
ncbi:MAG: Rne/Rng family ribonuclease [Chlorobi bacterium]|nr:Rne/Rng family ribonuclease [Chlorobiota bacterium]MCI0716208.1 Rne/Rng family ribonuclease [Chlorobiota bacterium]